MKNRNSCIEGFTLIELLVVVLIIGILASIALPQYQKAVEKARSAEAVSHFSTMKKQIDLFLLANGGHPSSTTYYEDFASVDIPGEIDQYHGIRTKFFLYESAECKPDRCEIMAIRTNGGDDDPVLYGFSCERRSGNNTWNCFCVTFFTDIGRSICKNLESQGFTYSDNEW